MCGPPFLLCADGERGGEASRQGAQLGGHPWPGGREAECGGSEPGGGQAGEGLREDGLSGCQGEGCPRVGESRDRGFFSLGFIKWNLKGNIEPEGGFLITSL